MSNMITPGGNHVCKHCGNWMMPGVNYCETGVCVCGDNLEHHTLEHSFVDAGPYNKIECERDDDHTPGAETLDEVSPKTRKKYKLDEQAD